MYRSPLSKVRKTEKGASLRRWFKEEWRTPSGDKDYSKGENLFRPTKRVNKKTATTYGCLLYTSPSPRDRTRSRMPSSA